MRAKSLFCELFYLQHLLPPSMEHRRWLTFTDRMDELPWYPNKCRGDPENKSAPCQPVVQRGPWGGHRSPRCTGSGPAPCSPAPLTHTGGPQHAGQYSRHPQEGVVKEFLAQSCGHCGHIILIPLLERAQAPVTALSGNPRQLGSVTRSLGV